MNVLMAAKFVMKPAVLNAMKDCSQIKTDHAVIVATVAIVASMENHATTAITDSILTRMKKNVSNVCHFVNNAEN